MLNFQSLLDGRKLHVHINHGESDKQSMASNNAKAYDRVFVAGKAAVQRHEAGLLEFDTSRPGADRPPAARPAPAAPARAERAPYRPLRADLGGRRGVQRLHVGRHPRRRDRARGLGRARRAARLQAAPEGHHQPEPDAIRAAHRAILALLGRGRPPRPRRPATQAVTTGDILAVIPDCDAMITDVSSVGLDWLYLRTDKPMFITDRHHDAERLRQEVPVSRCADVHRRVDVAELARPGRRPARARRAPPRPGRRCGTTTSTTSRSARAPTRFLARVGELVALRDRLVGCPAHGAAITA